MNTKVSFGGSLELLAEDFLDKFDYEFVHFFSLVLTTNVKK